MTDDLPRWDGDDVFEGVGTASWLIPSLDQLTRLAARPGWVAEAPETHLAPHLRDAVDAAGFRWLSDRVDSEGTYEVTLGLDPRATRRAARREAWVVIGSVAEQTSHVVERDLPEGTVFEVVTGAPDGAFAGHGHTVRLIISRTDR
jgi:hypothetical protein